MLLLYIATHDLGFDFLYLEISGQKTDDYMSLCRRRVFVFLKEAMYLNDLTVVCLYNVYVNEQWAFRFLYEIYRYFCMEEKHCLSRSL